MFVYNNKRYHLPLPPHLVRSSKRGSSSKRPHSDTDILSHDSGAKPTGMIKNECASFLPFCADDNDRTMDATDIFACKTYVSYCPFICVMCVIRLFMYIFHSYAIIIFSIFVFIVMYSRHTLVNYCILFYIGAPSTITTIPWKPGADIESLVQLRAVIEATLARNSNAQDLLTDYVTTL